MKKSSRVFLGGLRFALMSVIVTAALSLTACSLWYSILPYGLSHTESTLSIHSLGGLFTINDNYLLETGRLDSRYGIIDVTDPEAPVISFTNVLDFGASDAAFLTSGEKTYGYLADANALRVVDFSSLPTSATLLSTPVASGVQRVDISGSYLYVALDTGVLVYDLSSPQAPRQVQSIKYLSDGSSQLVQGACAGNGLYVVSTSSTGSICLRPFTIDSTGTLTAGATTTTTGYFGGELAMKGSVVIAVMDSDDIVGVNFSNPAQPVWGKAVNPHASKYDGDGSFGLSRMTIVNNYLVDYCTGDLPMAIFEISDAMNPTFIYPDLSQAVDDLPWGAQDALSVRAPYIYLAMYEQYLHIFKMP